LVGLLIVNLNDKEKYTASITNKFKSKSN